MKRAVREQTEAFNPRTILVEDRASGTQLIQELVREGIYAIKKYEPTIDKVMRMNAVTGTIENGLVHIPDKSAWLNEYFHELATFPKGKFDDQVNSTSQALHWFNQECVTPRYGLFEYYRQEAERLKADEQPRAQTITRGKFLKDLKGDWNF